MLASAEGLSQYCHFGEYENCLFELKTEKVKKMRVVNYRCNVRTCTCKVGSNALPPKISGNSMVQK